MVINGNDNVVSITSDGKNALYADDSIYWIDNAVSITSDDKCTSYTDDSMYWISDGTEETDHAGTSEKKRAKKIIKKFTLDMLASVGFTLALILSLMVVLFLIAALLTGYKG